MQCSFDQQRDEQSIVGQASISELVNAIENDHDEHELESELRNAHASLVVEQLGASICRNLRFVNVNWCRSGGCC